MTRSSRWLGTYASLAYAFLHLPLLILVVFSFNASKFTTWGGFSLDWYRAFARDQDLMEAAGNSLIIAIVTTVLTTACGTLAAYGLWTRTGTGR